MKQKEYVIEAMLKNGGYATFGKLNNSIDFSQWGTKTPFASVRRIVQTNKEFFRIQPGLWGLSDCKEKILKKLNIIENDQNSIELFTHSYFQGIITEIGNMRNFATYVPPQDKNKMFLEKRLSEITTIDKIYEFTYPEILRKARTVDVIWFNERKMPMSFYEVEHSTDIKNSLSKFYELQDFRADYFIVAAKERESQFNDIIASSQYKDIRKYTRFVNYDDLINQYNLEGQLLIRRTI